MPGNYPKESIQHSEHGESLKSRIQPGLSFMEIRYLLELKVKAAGHSKPPRSRLISHTW